jgi:formiminotetrahydrofolate cyclodeaminase
MNVLINMPSIENKKLRNRISDDLKIKKDDIEKSYSAAINEINKVLDS